MKLVVRSLVSLVVLAGLLGALGAMLFAPGLLVSAEIAAALIGGLALYGLGALALVGRPRLRARWARRHAAETPAALTAFPSREIALRARFAHRERTRIAA